MSKNIKIVKYPRADKFESNRRDDRVFVTNVIGPHRVLLNVVYIFSTRIWRDNKTPFLNFQCKFVNAVTTYGTPAVHLKNVNRVQQRRFENPQKSPTEDELLLSPQMTKRLQKHWL